MVEGERGSGGELGWEAQKGFWDRGGWVRNKGKEREGWVNNVGEGKRGEESASKSVLESKLKGIDFLNIFLVFFYIFFYKRKILHNKFIL